tara:strand:+ start:11916 stop:12101 length:186 start_codon:yes stop_codon:yes gene_type:complete
MTEQQKKVFKDFANECVEKMAQHMNMTAHQVKVAVCHNPKVAEQVFNFVEKKFAEWEAKKQ